MLDKIQLLFLSGRILGCTPYEIIGGQSMVVKKKSIVYCFFILIVSICLEVIRMYYNDYNVLNTKNLFFTIVRTILGYTCFITDIIMTICSSHRFKLTLRYLRSYDVAANFHEKSHYKNSLLNQIVVMIVFACWILVGCMAYQVKVAYPLLDVFAYSFVYFTGSVQVLQFNGLMLLLYRRFDHLNKLISPNGMMIFVI